MLRLVPLFQEGAGDSVPEHDLAAQAADVLEPRDGEAAGHDEVPPAPHELRDLREQRVRPVHGSRG